RASRPSVPPLQRQANRHRRAHRGQTMRTIGRVLLLGVGLAYAGCGSTSPKSAGSAIAPTRALSLPLTVVSAEGTVEGRSTRTAAFFPLEKGKSANGVTGVQTRGGGAVLELGDAEHGRGRL